MDSRYMKVDINESQFTGQGRVVQQPQSLRLSPMTRWLIPIELTPMLLSAPTAPTTPNAGRRLGIMGQPVFRKPTEEELTEIRGLSSPRRTVERSPGLGETGLFAARQIERDKLGSLVKPLGVDRIPIKHKKHHQAEASQVLEEREGGLSGWEGDDEDDDDNGGYDVDITDPTDQDEFEGRRPGTLPPRWFLRSGRGFALRPRRLTMNFTTMNHVA
ncbi:hypothetical protein BDN72DRAFT_899825 [Pluteus cervinus]|uniref:Uncharacterized protein n=1 Tax=Pluteus cervinus TaxID=181527 RepID=A0ACD3ALQ9_9AGAR|nr:hypothetical protein BDN72DRAFT_899825 [Pluteus cervinus]